MAWRSTFLPRTPEGVIDNKIRRGRRGRSFRLAAAEQAGRSAVATEASWRRTLLSGLSRLTMLMAWREEAMQGMKAMKRRRKWR
ncbi:hypothetical protein E2C01_096056 [Portunus trituberculatus]|uniref:Uncharacterized protein n=1 Tax=Portunus trituberculatus TaxID=210409 RepID=A0A5B7K111_PORTR|nr:hypothetical protein [Portunus trituberculatus]